LRTALGGKRWTTEIFVTDRRVIFVHGFFDRQSIEVHMNQIESVDVDQRLLGRLFHSVESNGSRNGNIGGVGFRPPSRRDDETEQ
jgi:hypothetical protein